MTLRRQSPQAFSEQLSPRALPFTRGLGLPARGPTRFALAHALLFALAFDGCGGGSSLDDYSEGIPDIVPPAPPLRADAGSSAHDAGRDAGNSGGGGAAGGNAGGGAAGGGGGKSQIGGSCMTAQDCANQGATCLTALPIVNIPFPAGYCTTSMCQDDTQCPTGAGCYTLAQYCLDKCTRTSDCRAAEGYTCAAAPLGGGTSNFCLPSDVAGLIGGAGGQAAGLIGGLGGLLGGSALGGLLGGGTNAAGAP